MDCWVMANLPEQASSVHELAESHWTSHLAFLGYVH